MDLTFEIAVIVVIISFTMFLPESLVSAIRHRL